MLVLHHRSGAHSLLSKETPNNVCMLRSEFQTVQTEVCIARCVLSANAPSFEDTLMNGHSSGERRVGGNAPSNSLSEPMVHRSRSDPSLWMTGSCSFLHSPLLSRP